MYSSAIFNRSLIQAVHLSNHPVEARGHSNQQSTEQSPRLPAVMFVKPSSRYAGHGQHSEKLEHGGVLLEPLRVHSGQAALAVVFLRLGQGTLCQEGTKSAHNKAAKLSPLFGTRRSLLGCCNRYRAPEGKGGL